MCWGCSRGAQSSARRHSDWPMRWRLLQGRARDARRVETTFRKVEQSRAGAAAVSAGLLCQAFSVVLARSGRVAVVSILKSLAVDHGKTGDVFRIAWNGGPSHGGRLRKGGITVT